MQDILGHSRRRCWFRENARLWKRQGQPAGRFDENPFMNAAKLHMHAGIECPGGFMRSEVSGG
jgi:hypothetical protein